jgi:hypothetical protein
MPHLPKKSLLKILGNSYLFFLSLGFHMRMALAMGRSIVQALPLTRLWELALAAPQTEVKTVNYITTLLSLRSIGGCVLGMGYRKYIRSAVINSLRHPFISFVLRFLSAVLVVFSVKSIFDLPETFYILLFFSLLPLGCYGKKLSDYSAASLTEDVQSSSTDYFKALVFLTPFLAIVYFFHRYDIASSHYSVGGNVLFLYNILKIFLCFYLFIIFHSAGFVFSSYSLFREIILQFSPLERFLLHSFIGIGLLTVLFFFLGLAGFLSVPIALAVSAPLVYAGYFQAAQNMRELKKTVGLFRMLSDAHGIIVAEIVTLLVLVAYVLLVRGLFVGDLSYDEVAHYQPYFKTVIKNGGTAFNDYWYHFYISKGAGLFFLGSLLGDYHTPLIVSFVSFTLTGLGGCYFIHRATGSIEWTLLGLIIYFVAPVVPGYEVFLRLNLMSGALITGVVLSIYLLPNVSIKSKLCWSLYCLPIYLGFMVLTPTSAAFIVPLLGIYFLAALCRGRLAHALNYFIWAAISVMAVITLLVYNYYVTGLAEGTPLRTFFNFADTAKLNKLVSSYLVLFIEEASSRGLGQLNLLGVFQLDLQRISDILQAHRYAFLFAGGSLLWLSIMFLWVGGGLAFGRRVVRTSFVPLLPALIFISVAILMAHINEQDQSVLRFLFSVKIFIIAFIMVLWKAFFELLPAFRFRRNLELGIIIVFSVWALQAMLTTTADLKRYPYYFDFLTGRIGIQDSYRAMTQYNQGVWGPCLKVREMTSPSDKILQMNVTVASGTCHMIPDREFRLELGNSFGGLWHEMVFSDDAEKAMAAFKKAGINYFLFDPREPLFGCTAYSTLFRPENIGRYLQISDISKNGVIFTWRTIGSPPISDAFITNWKKHLASEMPWQMGEMCSRVNGYYKIYGLNKRPSQDFNLRPLRSWQ